MPNQDPYIAQEIAQELLSHQTFLRRLAIDLVGKDADDLVQDVWQQALERPPHHARQLRGWLARVARNLAANRWRGDARRTEREERRAMEQPASDKLESRFEMRKELIGALDSLGPSCRETILLRYFEGLAPSEIAKRNGIPIATVKTRLRRGLGQLREALDKRHDGDRATWMSAVTSLAAPAGNGVATGTLLIKGMVMGTMMKVSAAVLVAATCVYFATRTPRTESPPIAALDSVAEDVGRANPAVAFANLDAAIEVEQRSPIAEDQADAVAATSGSKVLRLILEGITEENARRARVTLTGVEAGHHWPPVKIQDSWMCVNSTSEFAIDQFLARVAGGLEILRDDELKLTVDHPLHFSETIKIPLSSGTKLANGQTVYEVRVRFADVSYWPEFTLTVRDAETRAHLEDVELRMAPTAFMGLLQQPGTDDPFTQVGEGLSSPIGLLGGRKPNAPKGYASGLALSPPADETPRPAELTQPEENERGIMLYARAPGHAWGRIVLDVSKGSARELLLKPAASLHVRFANVQLERYAELGKKATLCIMQIGPDGSEDALFFQELDETLAAEGLLIEGLPTGEHAVSVELGEAFSWRTRPVLARKELDLAPGQAHELLLALPDSPAPVERATLAGVVSFPAFSRLKDVRLQLYAADYEYGDPDHELSLAEMDRTFGALPTWSFKLEDLPVGIYQVELMPFQKGWMIELPADGAKDVKLVLPELAEVLVETVDAQTGERIPLENIRYGYREVLSGRVRHDWSRVRLSTEFEDEPGRFRFWTAPGPAYVQTFGFPSGLDYGSRRKDLELVPGLQAVRLKLSPSSAIHFEFRVDGARLPREDGVFAFILGDGIRGVDHDGRASAMTYEIYEVSAPGVYEISFEGVGTDRFQPIPSRRVELSAGETAKVIIDLQRK